MSKHELPTSFPIPHYASETCLDMITQLPTSSLRPGKPKYRFPGTIAPLEPYLSLLPPSKLGLDRANDDSLSRPKDHALTHPDDPEVDKILYMGVEMEAMDDGSRPTGKDRRASLFWILPSIRVAENASVRALCLEPSSSRPVDYWVNFGPASRINHIITYFSSSAQGFIKANGVAFLPVSSKKLSVEKRKEMEGIAWNVGVLHQEGYNSQNWVACVLAVAVVRGILEEEDARNALEELMKPEPQGLVYELPI